MSTSPSTIIYQCNIRSTGHNTVPLEHYSTDEQFNVTNYNDQIGTSHLYKEYNGSPLYNNKDIEVSKSRNIPLKFNKIVELDIHYIKDQPILHMVDYLTKYSASILLSSTKTENIINMITENWVNIFCIYQFMWIHQSGPH